MFQKILIANRGEIALRIIRAAKELGIKSVLVYSQADADSLPVRFADESICIGPPESAKSYLNIPQIIAAAELCGADAIHPGYGFLSENAEFAEICAEHGITFIGPSPNSIRAAGDKLYSKRVAKKVGIPVLEGSLYPVSSLMEAKKICDKIGYPVIIKAAGGGGGKGMRIVQNEDELGVFLEQASCEAEASFSNPNIYIEKYLKGARHIEIQIISDGENTYALGERECSVQIRYQKLIEESPSTIVDRSFRARLEKYAIRFAKAVGYKNVGTVEFLVDEKRNPYFLEMNTRIQVEHPVTEEVYGVDIVKEQILIAMGRKCKIRRSAYPQAHAIECRVFAIDVENGFVPSPGRIEALHLPGGPGVRIDTHIHEGYIVPPYYDAMIAKIICFAKTRQETIKRTLRALSECIFEGIKTTIPFIRKIIESTPFVEGKLDTEIVKRFLSS